MASDVEISTCQSMGNKKAEEVKRFICSYENCLSAFNRQWKLDAHICSHTGERPFKCNFPDCNKSYIRKQHLQRHINLSHEKIKVPKVYISCPYSGCLRQFQNKYSLKKHCRSHHEYRCLECNISFKKRIQYISHSNKHKGLLLFVCKTCGRSFACEKDLAQHEKKHKVYICDYAECQEKFMYWSSLRKHFKYSHPKCYECDFCQRLYANKNTLMKHILGHLQNGKGDVYLCPFQNCLKYYKYKSNLKHHIEVIHNGKRYRCTEENCTSVFKSKSRLVSHQKRHQTGETVTHKDPASGKTKKPKKDKGLKKKSEAVLLSGIYIPPDKEERIAQNKVTPEVNQCINQTLETSKESMHVNDVCNSNEEESSCEVKETSPSNNLFLCVSNVKLKYNLPKCYECDFCQRLYANKHTLMKHISGHLQNGKGEVYLCSFKNCLKYYKYKNNLNQHIEVIHYGKRYRCTEENCTSVFKSKRRLVSHQKRHQDPASGKTRKPRKEKGLKKKSEDVLLSNIYLPPDIEERIAQNKVTPEVNQVNQTLETLKESMHVNDVCNGNEEESSCEVKETSPSNNVLYVSDVKLEI